MKTEVQYSSDLTNRQWQLIRQLLPKPARRGRRPIDRRRIINAILFLVRTGCQWRMLPKSYPNWNTVYGVFRRWRDGGIWQRIHDRLREKVRKASGKKSTPTVAIVDSQSVRTAEGGEERGYDAGKKITGRKRHLAVDTLGMVLAVVVHSAAIQDQTGDDQPDVEKAGQRSQLNFKTRSKVGMASCRQLARIDGRISVVPESDPEHSLQLGYESVGYSNCLVYLLVT